MAQSSRVIYRPRADATPKSELSALVAVYRFIIFDCHAKKKAARPGGLDDAEGPESDRTDTEIIPG
jgi:hypothetical protein